MSSSATVDVFRGPDGDVAASRRTATQLPLTQLQHRVAPPFCKSPAPSAVQRASVSASDDGVAQRPPAGLMLMLMLMLMLLLLLPLLAGQQEVFPPLHPAPVATHQHVGVVLLVRAHPAALVRQLRRPVPQQLVPGDARGGVGFAARGEFGLRAAAGVGAGARVHEARLGVPAGPRVALHGAVEAPPPAAALGLPVGRFGPGVVDVSGRRRVHQSPEVLLLLLPRSAPPQLLLPLPLHLLLHLRLPLSLPLPLPLSLQLFLLHLPLLLLHLSLPLRHQLLGHHAPVLRVPPVAVSELGVGVVVVATLVGVAAPHVHHGAGVLLLRRRGQARRVGRPRLPFLRQPPRREDVVAPAVVHGGGAVGGRRRVAGSPPVLLRRRAVVQSPASPQHPHGAAALVVLLRGYQRSPVAGGGAAGGEDRRGRHARESGVSVGRVEEGAAAGAVAVQTRPVGFVELDRGNPENTDGTLEEVLSRSPDQI
ncbi:hypothetical protein EYF80_044683 [Liparis tanakae]|uniref:Uncharacterized protein n=1 Tax=Liparis tanakae TaxID=230148 RepID=A0A4Z2FX85_9TELE|nr:hypothetical protein EYF80_044683 [Liparis tanakae]